CLLDFPGFGVDANAVYIGGNMFCPSAYSWSDAFVIPKATLLGLPNGGTAVPTAFRNVTNGASGPGPFAPQGVDNDDPSATEGYFIGNNVVENSTLQVLRITTPGSTPTYSGTPLSIQLPLNTPGFNQPALGSTTNVNVPGDTRL